MKQVIEKISEPSDSELKYCLDWLAESKNHALHDYQRSTIIRYLLKKNLELESAIEELKNKPE